MFETHASWQYDFPSPFKDPGMQHWVAVTMAVQMPCYLLVSRTAAAGAGAEELSGPPRTTLVADEQMLRHLLQSIRPALLLTLHVLLPGRGEGRWGVWRTSVCARSGSRPRRNGGKGRSWCSSYGMASPGMTRTGRRWWRGTWPIGSDWRGSWRSIEWGGRPPRLLVRECAGQAREVAGPRRLGRANPALDLVQFGPDWHGTQLCT